MSIPDLINGICANKGEINAYTRPSGIFCGGAVFYYCRNSTCPR